MAKFGKTLIALVRLTNLLTHELAPLLERHRLTPQQWLLLAALATSEEPPTLAGLARALLVTKQNMTGMTTRLESLGLLRRVADPTDLRAMRVHLTRRGAAIHEKIEPEFERWAERVLGTLSGNERKSFAWAVSAMLRP